MNVEITPELLSYAKAIVTERRITKDEITQEIMGDVLKEALRRMDRAITRLRENPEARSVMARGIYHNVSIAKA